MTSGNKVAPTTTALQARVMIYQPSLRPEELKEHWIDTSFGRCRVTGRLGQRHADVVEGMLYVAERKRDVSDGGVEILVDPAKLRRTLSDNQYSFGQIEKLVTELRAATITIETSQFDFPIIGGLIDHVIPSPMTRLNPLTGGERHLWRVRLGAAMVMLLEHDLSLYYRPKDISRLQYGISQAVARHILTHKNDPAGGWHMDTLIRAVSGNVKGQKIRDARKRLRKDVLGLSKLGIEITDENRVKRGTPAR
ncbi:TPA: ABC transporter ATPase [Vibrio parahaemolyticus]|nr:ABC transporter ATPase [Vibrio parahaemolyticus]